MPVLFGALHRIEGVAVNCTVGLFDEVTKNKTLEQANGRNFVGLGRGLV